MIQDDILRKKSDSSGQKVEKEIKFFPVLDACKD